MNLPIRILAAHRITDTHDGIVPAPLSDLPSVFPCTRSIGGYANASPSQAQSAYRCALVLRDLVAPYLLRRMKRDIMRILPMPKKTEQVRDAVWKGEGGTVV